jgi:beta-D-xylosidase 4
MQGTTPAAIPRLGLTEATFGGEALHGVVAKCINASGVRRCPSQFPAPLALGATFSKKLFHAVGTAISVEARALYNFGCPTCPPGKKAWGVEGDLWLAFYAPNINLLRDSRWGRVAEVVSEDVLTTMTFAREFTAGMLGEGEPGHASKYWRTLPICKHFTAYSLDVDVDPTDATFGWTRSNISQNVTRRDLAESYLPAFEGCIRKNQPGGPGVMCALNAHSIDGHPSVPSCASRELLNNTLYGSMGFTSFVVGDCNAVQQIGVGYGGAKAVHPDSHQYAVDAAAAIQDALAAPVTSDCGEAYRRGMATLVANGSVPASQLRPLVRRLLLARLRLGTLDSPANVPYQKIGAENVESAKHTALSRIAARSAVVILKNTGDLLPLVPTRLTSIALAGPIVNATDLFLGPYSGSSPSSPQSIVTAIRSASAFKHVVWSPGCAVNGPDGSRIDAAVAAATDADIHVAVVGLGLCGHTDAVCNGTLNEGEGSDRASLALPGQQVQLLRAIVSSRHAKGLPTVLVVSSGGAVDLAEFVADEGVAAILWSAPGGKWGGSAFVDVMLSTGEPLDGVAVGGGRMPYTIFPTGYVEALPYADLDMRRGGGRTYRFSAAPKVFEFGSGLNVMNFSVSFELESDTITTNETAAVRVSVTNHGLRKATASMATNACGAFSVLGFVSPVAGDSSFVKQLFDFSRLDCVVVGSTVNLTLQVTPWARSEVDMNGRRFSKPGEFRVTIADAESNRPVSLKVLGPSTTLTDYFGNGSSSVKHKTDDDPARPEHELWVDATSGSDHADGSKASPLRSLATAAARMRQLKAAGGSCIVHVAATGTYAPLHLDANDSNTAWRCHGGSLCEVSAGARPGNISAHWTTSTDPRLPTVARGSVLEITLDPAQAALLAPSTANHGGPGGGHMPTDPHTSLYFKGKAMQLARYPNLGLSAFQTGPATNWSIVPSTGVGECLNWTDDRPARWAAAAARGDLQLHGMFFVQWKDSYVYNVSVDLQKRQLCHEGGYPVYGVAKGGVYYAFNLLEELDRPGEFVMDAREKKLFFWPPTSFDPTKVLLSNATSILSLANGTANVSVQGFAFRHSRGAGVAAIGPERFELDRCEVTDTGGEGVSIGAEPGTDVRYSEPLGGSHRVTNSTISRTGLAGVVVSCGRRRTLEACNALVSDNHISNFARWGLTYQPGIALAGVGVVAEHNRIERGPHLGLSAAGNDHVFSRNVISDVCLETWDTGALYVGGDWSYYNNSVIENLFFNVGRPNVHCNSPTTSCERHHVYIDEWGSGWNIIGNAFVGSPSHTSFYLSHCGRDNLLRNNIFLNSSGLVAQIEGDSGLRPGINSTLFAELYKMPFQSPPWSTRYPRLAQLPYNQPALPKGNEVACNVAIDQSGMPAICFGTGMPHNSPNACINKDGYLTLQVEFYNQSSCFNISGPSLATNASASTVFVSPNPQATFDFRLLPSAHQRLPCFTPFPTGVGPRTVASGSALKIDDHLNGNRCGTEILLWNGLCQPTKNWPPTKPLTRKVVTPTYLAAKPAQRIAAATVEHLVALGRAHPPNANSLGRPSQAPSRLAHLPRLCALQHRVDRIIGVLGRVKCCLDIVRALNHKRIHKQLSADGNINCARSTDGGLTWAHCTEQQRMEDGGCAGVRTIEVNQSSYSSLTAMGADQLGVLYERGPAWGDKGCSGVSCRISFTTIDALLTPPPTTTLKLDDDAAAVTLIWDIDKSATVNTPAGVLRGDRGLSCTERWCDGQNGNATNIYGHVGLYPDLTRGINGGIPQKGNLSAHLEKFRVDFAALVPSPDYRGFCLLDFEQFRGDWNSTPDAYRAASVAAAGGNETLGKLQYETAAKAFMLGTIAAVKAVRPGCKTGYYGYPRNDLPTAAGVSPSFKKYCDAHPFDCTFAGYGHGAAGDAQRALNDELHWLFEASTAVFPSIYLGVLPEDAAHHSVANNTRYIQQTVEEAIRLSSADKVVPVTWYLYDNYPRSPHWHSLSAGDLRTELEVPLQAGAKALLLWGATSNTTAGIGEADLQKYVNQTLSPLVAEICAKYGCPGAERTFLKTTDNAAVASRAPVAVVVDPTHCRPSQPGVVCTLNEGVAAVRGRKEKLVQVRSGLVHRLNETLRLTAADSGLTIEAFLSPAEAGANKSMECASSYCSARAVDPAAVCPICCGQPGGSSGGQYVCTKSRPVCRGYAAGVHWGGCYPASAAPVVSGGVAVTGWELVNASRNMWAAPMPSVGLSARQLYVNGRRSVRTQGNATVLLGELAVDPPHLTHQNASAARGYRASLPSLTGWGNAADMEMVYTAQVLPWVQWRCGLSSISADGHLINMAPCFHISPGYMSLAMRPGVEAPSHLRWYNSGLPSTIENAFELLRHPGEHYISRQEERVYYIARPGESMENANATVPLLTTLLAIDSATNISLRGLDFEHSAFVVPRSTGYMAIQAGVQKTGLGGGFGGFRNAFVIPSAVSVSSSQMVTVHSCGFAHLGGTGLAVGNGSQHVSIESSLVTDVSGSGIVVGGVHPCPHCVDCWQDDSASPDQAVLVKPCPVEPMPKMDFNISITDTVISHVTREFADCAGVWVGYVFRFNFQFNDVCNVNTDGLSLGWGWNIPRNGTYQGGFNVSNNRISHFLDKLFDGGATYSLGAQLQKSYMHDNWIHHANGSGIEPSDSGLPDCTPPAGCAASYCEQTQCPICCGQPGGKAGLTATCPQNLPVCVGYVANQDWGHCSAAANDSGRLRTARGAGPCYHGGGFYFDQGSTNWSVVGNVATTMDRGAWFFENCSPPEGSTERCQNIAVGENWVDETSAGKSAGQSPALTNLVNVSAGIDWPVAARAIMAGAGPRAGQAHPESTSGDGCCVNMIPPPLPPPAPPPFKFEVVLGVRQLFVDSLGLQSILNLRTVMHQANKKGAVIRPGDARGFGLNGSLQTRSAPGILADGTWRLMVADSGSADGVETFTWYNSSNGIQWFPDRRTNERLKNGVWFTPYDVVYDKTDPKAPYKTVLRGPKDDDPSPSKVWGGGNLISVDGHSWEKVPGVSALPSEDEYNLSLDPVTGQFISTRKQGAPVCDLPLRGCRAVDVAESHDFYGNWTRHGTVFWADEEDQLIGRAEIAARISDPSYAQADVPSNKSWWAVDVYNMGAFRYESVYIGMPAMFHAIAPIPVGDCLDQGTCNSHGFHLIKLTTSRNLVNWTRVGNRSVFIPPSKRGAGAYDIMQMLPPSAPVITKCAHPDDVCDELFFYYTGLKYRAPPIPGGPLHDGDAGAIHLATLRRDGFVSLDAPAENAGTVTTQPFFCPSSATILFINFNARQTVNTVCTTARKPTVVVQVLVQNMVQASSMPLVGNHLAANVSLWAPAAPGQQRRAVASFAHQLIALRFSLSNGAALYSYWFDASTRIKSDDDIVPSAMLFDQKASRAMWAAVSATSAAALKTNDNTNLVVNPSFEMQAAVPPSDSEPALGWHGSSKIYSRETAVVHKPSTAALQYNNHDSSVYATCSQRVMQTRPGGRYNASVWVKTINITGPKADLGGASLCVEFQPFQPDKYPNGYYPQGVTGTNEWTQVSTVFTVPPACGGGDAVVCHVTLDVYVRKGETGVAFFDEVILTELGSWNHMDTVLIHPQYRGQIASSACTEIHVRAHLVYKRYDHTTADLELQATLHSRQHSTAPPLETITITGGRIQPTVDLIFKATPISLSPGAYVVNCTLRNSSTGEVFSSSSHNVTRLADTARPRNGSWIDEQQRLIVDGKPFFPIGLYLSSAAHNPPGWNSSMSHLATIGQSKFNTIMPYEEAQASGCGIMEGSVMDKIAQAGLKIMFSLKDTYYKGSACWPASITSRATEEQFVRSQIRKFKQHPALLGWYLQDEMAIEAGWGADLRAHYRWAVEEDPSHITWACLGAEATFELQRYLDTTDVIGTDKYPICQAYNASSTNNNVATIGPELALARNQTDSARPLWQVLQAMNWRNYGSKLDCFTPSAAQERSMAWQAIIAGANGVFFFAFWDFLRNPDVPFTMEWARLSTIAAEIDRFAPMLLSDAAPATKVTVGSGQAVIWLATRSHWAQTGTETGTEKQMYVFAVNDGNGGGLASFALGGGYKASSVHVVSESPTRTIKAEPGGGFSDTVQRLDVAVYQVNCSKSASPLKTDDTNDGSRTDVIDVRAFGAKADGKFDNTAVFASAVKACNQTNGCTFLVAPSATANSRQYMLRSLQLVSNMILVLHADIVAPVIARWDGEALITALDERNITIRGPGAIDGLAQRNGMWNYMRQNPHHSTGICLVRFTNCTDVRLSAGLIVRNAPNWHVDFTAEQVCTDTPCTAGGLVMENMSVVAEQAVAQGANGVAGVSIVSTTGRLVHLRGVRIVTEDDDIEISANRGGLPTRNVLVERCSFGTGHGASMHTNVRDITYRDNKFNGTSTGFRIKTHLGFNDAITNVSFLNSAMTNVGMPIMINEFYFSNSINATTAPVIAGITVDGLHASLTDKAAKLGIAGCLFCARDTPCTQLSIRNVHVTGVHAVAPQFYCHHAFGISDNAPASCLQHNTTQSLQVVPTDRLWFACTGYKRVRPMKIDDERSVELYIWAAANGECAACAQLSPSGDSCARSSCNEPSKSCINGSSCTFLPPIVDAALQDSIASGAQPFLSGVIAYLGIGLSGLRRRNSSARLAHASGCPPPSANVHVRPCQCHGRCAAPPEPELQRDGQRRLAGSIPQFLAQPNKHDCIHQRCSGRCGRVWFGRLQL